MTNRNTFSTIVLILGCIRVLSFFISFIGIRWLGNGLVDDFLNALYHVNTAIHITVMLFIAYALSLIKEDIWRSVAFILLALMSATYMLLTLTKLIDAQILKVMGLVNVAVMVYFVIQSFQIKNQYFKTTFRIYSMVVLLIVGFNMLIPLIFYKMALPMSSLRYTSMLSIFPAVVECYIVYLFYQHFNRSSIYLNNDFISNL
jgi:hypothetical protein